MENMTLINTWYYWYEPYVKQFCEDEGMPVPEEDSNEWWQAIDSMRGIAVDDFWADLKYSAYNNRRCVVAGSLGLWHGARQICPAVYDTLTEAIEACVKSADDYKVFAKNGELRVTAYHHDGRNNFTVHVIKDDVDSLEKLALLEYEDEDDIDFGRISERIDFLW